jgi:hypothetical protein
MHEDFGARVDGRSVELSLFFPDNTVDPSQYEGDGDPPIHSLQVAGTFQPHLGTAAWDPATAPALTPRPHPNGVRWTVDLGAVRWCGDPGARYIIGPDGNAGFIVGGPRTAAVEPIGTRLPLKDLVVYELMPWTAWPGGSFSWGCNPFALFADEDRYLAEAGGRLFALHRQLVRLRQAHPALRSANFHPRPYDGASSGSSWCSTSRTTTSGPTSRSPPTASGPTCSTVTASTWAGSA